MRELKLLRLKLKWSKRRIRLVASSNERIDMKRTIRLNWP